MQVRLSTVEYLLKRQYAVVKSTRVQRTDAAMHLMDALAYCSDMGFRVPRTMLPETWQWLYDAADVSTLTCFQVNMACRVVARQSRAYMIEKRHAFL